MTNFSKNSDFHKPFIKELVFVALVTIVSMISMRYFLNILFPIHQNTPNIIYTDSQTQSD